MNITKIKVGALVYDCKEVEQAYLDQSSKDCIGRTTAHLAAIDVLDSMNDMNKLVTLWHEIVHIIANQRNMELTENQIDALSYGVAEVLLDNPCLLEEVTRCRST